MTSKSDWTRFGTIAKLSRGKVLDMHCNKGEMSTVLAIFGLDVFGIDENEVNIRLAKKRATNLGLKCWFTTWNKCRLSLSENTFDTVVLNANSLVIRPDISRIREAARLCVSGGRIILCLQSHSTDRVSYRNTIEQELKDVGFRFVKWVTNGEHNWYVGYAENRKIEVKPQYGDIASLFPESTLLEPLDTSQKVSVIITTYNRANLLGYSLESVLNQTYPNVEIIVVNDGSSDNTDEVVRRYRRRVVYLKKENGGKASAVNLALKCASGKYIWIFDDDDIALPRKLEMDIRCFQRNPDTGVVHSRGYLFDHATGEIFSTYMGRALEPDEAILKLLEDTYILNTSMLVKKECYERVGRYREDLIRSEDYEMWFRLARHFKLAHLDCPTVLVRTCPELWTNNSKRIAFGAERIYEYEKMLFAEIRQTFPLQDFYPPLSQGPADPYLKAAALVERARIMNLHRVDDLAREDLRQVADLVRTNRIKIQRPLTDRLIDLWQEAVANDNPMFSGCLFKCMRQLSAGTRNGGELNAYIAKRYFWSFLNNLKLCRLTQSIQRLIISLHFLVAAARSKLSTRISENVRS